MQVLTFVTMSKWWQNYCFFLSLYLYWWGEVRGETEGFVQFRIRSSRVYAVSRTLRAHLQSSAERMEMRLKQGCIKCHHSLHTNTSIHSPTVSHANIQSQTFTCTTVLAYFLFSHTIDVITAQQKEPADSQKVFLFVCFFICLVTWHSEWLIDSCH